MDKDIRCLVCRNTFTKKELEDAECCPTCGYQGMTMLTKYDTEVKINWLELRIICTWAEQFGIQGADDHSINAFYSIIKELQNQLPEDFAPITYHDGAKVEIIKDETSDGTLLN